MDNLKILARNISGKPHKRYNPLTGEWILVSPHRTSRPWLGQTEKTISPDLPAYDPECYLCPGNSRAGEKENPDYQGVMVFDNDFPALIPGGSSSKTGGNSLCQARTESGICRVMCFSPLHNLTMAKMDKDSIVPIVETWKSQNDELGAMNWINYVQIFENKGPMMGCSNPHPHCQIWASSSLPEEIHREQAKQALFLREQNRCLLCGCLEEERNSSFNRTVVENKGFSALVPFWAIWPFETMIISRKHLSNISEFTSRDTEDLAEILRRLTIKYDNLFETSFPYSMGIHQSPSDGKPHEEWHFHMHFYPPLLRSATVKKFMVGYELLATPQRDITPESAAEQLQGLPEIHWEKV
ncbi:MAG: UDP-glucose--hexose-1-phosphate uridylyltransferase [Acidobacteriota bacterium]